MPDKRQSHEDGLAGLPSGPDTDITAHREGQAQADRLYFSVAAEIKKEEELAAKGLAPQRGLFKRCVFGLLWMIPVFIVFNSLFRLVVTMLDHGRPREIADIYTKYSEFLYTFDTIAWYLLCLFGLLPGTAKSRRKRPVIPDSRNFDS